MRLLSTYLLKPKAVICLLVIFNLFEFRGANAQKEILPPNLSDFFTKLRTIKPIKELLHYDSFPNFDFAGFEPLQTTYGSKKISYVIGSTRDKTIRSITLLNVKEVIGTMSVYDFQSFKILTFEKRESVLSQYPDFPIVCISKDSRFIVYLNERFEFQHTYKPADIASIQILRDDLFPVYILTVRNKYVRMMFEINYINGRSKIVDKVRTIIVFDPQKDKGLLITDQGHFSEECYIPAADFIVNLHPKVKNDEVPFWVYSGNFDFE